MIVIHRTPTRSADNFNGTADGGNVTEKKKLSQLFFFIRYNKENQNYTFNTQANVHTNKEGND